MPIAIQEVFDGFIDFGSDAFGRNFNNASSTSGYQNHHLIPTAEANRSDMLKLLDWFGENKSNNKADYYDHRDFDQNGITVPVY